MWCEIICSNWRIKITHTHTPRRQSIESTWMLCVNRLCHFSIIIIYIIYIGDTQPPQSIDTRRSLLNVRIECERPATYTIYILYISYQPQFLLLFFKCHDTKLELFAHVEWGFTRNSKRKFHTDCGLNGNAEKKMKWNYAIIRPMRKESEIDHEQRRLNVI